MFVTALWRGDRPALERLVRVEWPERSDALLVVFERLDLLQEVIDHSEGAAYLAVAETEAEREELREIGGWDCAPIHDRLRPKLREGPVPLPDALVILERWAYFNLHGKPDAGRLVEDTILAAVGGRSCSHP